MIISRLFIYDTFEWSKDRIRSDQSLKCLIQIISNMGIGKGYAKGPLKHTLGSRVPSTALELLNLKRDMHS